MLVRAYYLYLRIAGGDYQLLEQLRAVSISGKLIPVVIQSCLARKPIPVYGDGMNVRDWLYVGDHAEALWQVLTGGKEVKPITSAVITNGPISGSWN